MQSTQLASVLILLIAIIFTCDSQLTRLCRDGSCGDECELICEWGYRWNDICGFNECRKGPGDRCIEYRRECGENLQCRCGRCHGCSSTNLATKCHASPCLEF